MVVLFVYTRANSACKFAVDHFASWVSLLSFAGFAELAADDRRAELGAEDTAAETLWLALLSRQDVEGCITWGWVGAYSYIYLIISYLYACIFVSLCELDVCFSFAAMYV